MHELGHTKLNGKPQPDLSRQVYDLSTHEAMALLGTVPLGRVVFTRNALPAIRPVTHIVIDDVIIIRVHLGAAIISHAAVSSAVVAYEADDLDAAQQLGWSVIVTGIARIVNQPDLIEEYEKRLRSWLPGHRDSFISIHATFVTGSRFVVADGQGGTKSTESLA